MLFFTKRKYKGKIFHGNVEFADKKCCVCDSDENLEILSVTKDIRINQKIITVICNECGLVFLNPAPTEKTYVEFYKSQRSVGAPRKKKEEFIFKKKYLYKLFVNILKNNIEDLNELDVVDVGSGNGAFLYYLKPFVRSLRALELSDNAQIDIPRFFDCEVIQSSNLKSEISSNSLDLVTSMAVIEHYSDPLNALRDYYEALKVGGKVFLHTLDIKGVSLQGGENAYFKFVHPYYFSTETLSNLVEKVGFRNIRCWEFAPGYEGRSISNPSNVTAGFFVLLAEKVEAPVGAISYEGLSDEIKNCLYNSRLVESKFKFKLWLHFVLKIFGLLKKNMATEKYKSTFESYVKTGK